MTTARTYGDPCAVARALDLIGERWALIIVRELLFGPKRFTDLQAGLPHASPTVLTQRLRDLEEGGVIHRRRLGSPARAWIYELTAWGHDLEPILAQLGSWGRHSPVPRAVGATMGADALMLALRSHLQPARLGELNARILIGLGGDLFTLDIADGGLVVTRGEPAGCDAAVRTDPATFQALLIDRSPASEFAEQLDITGDIAAVHLLFDALGLSAFPA